jgi:hypothetical protein
MVSQSRLGVSDYEGYTLSDTQRQRIRSELKALRREVPAEKLQCCFEELGHAIAKYYSSADMRVDSPATKRKKLEDGEGIVVQSMDWVESLDGSLFQELSARMQGNLSDYIAIITDVRTALFSLNTDEKNKDVGGRPADEARTIFAYDCLGIIHRLTDKEPTLVREGLYQSLLTVFLWCATSEASLEVYSLLRRGLALYSAQNKSSN